MNPVVHARARRRPEHSAPGFLLILSILALTAPNAARAAGRPGDPGPPFSAADTALVALARTNLERHVDAAGLRDFRAQCDPATARAFDYLFAWLPPPDLAAWRAEQVKEDLALALAARAEAPWRDRVSEGQFLTWVLPHRVAQEPVQAWRRPLRERLWPRVRDLSLRDAILETNRFCREQATFTPTSARDQGPLTTIARGLGRCEEETILFICAARSVGIPARVAWTPWWMSGDNNHAWVEAWDGERWRYLGACEPAAGLDQAWFTEPARRAGLVLSGAYGEPATGGDEVYSRGQGVTLINSTGVYTSPGRLRVEWGDLRPAPATGPASTAAAAPATGPARADSIRAARAAIKVTVHVVNSGTLMPLAEFAAADSITLGPGDYFVSCAVDSAAAGAFVRVEPGRVTPALLEPDRFVELFREPVRLRVPTPPARPAAEPHESSGPVTAALLSALEDSLRLARRSEETADSVRLAAYARELETRDATGAGPVIELFRQVPRRAEAWYRFLQGSVASEWPAAIAFVRGMDDKDLLEADTTSARAWIREALHRRNRELPDSLWASFVVPPRIDRQPYDPALVALPFFAADSGTVSPREVHARFAARVRRAEPTRLGHLATPSETWASGWATPAAARIALTGLLRRHGVAARVEPGRRWVEAWHQGRWVPCDPLDAASWDRREAEVARAYELPARLRVALREDDSLFAAAEPGRHVLLARFQNGRFEPDFEQEYAIAGGELDLTLEPGVWWIFGVMRDADGSPRLRAVRRALAAGEDGGTVVLDLGPRALAAAIEPAAATGAAGPAAAGCGDPPPWWLPAVRRIGGEQADAGRPALVAIWDRMAEPTIRMRPALEGSRGDAGVLPAGDGLQVISVYLEEDAPSSPSGGRLLGVEERVVSLRPEEALDRFARDPRLELPFLLLLDAQGEPRLCLAGMRLDAGDALRRELRALEGR